MDLSSRDRGFRRPPRAGTRRTSRALAIALLAVGVSTGQASGSARAVIYAAPLSTVRVASGFDDDASRYGPGHRGVDLVAVPGQPVAAAAEGTVTFAGVVVDRAIVVIAHADGVRTTYEPVRPSVIAGARVERGQVIGAVEGLHGGRADVLHWGARRGDAYLDPLRLVRTLGAVRLAPTR